MALGVGVGSRPSSMPSIAAVQRWFVLQFGGNASVIAIAGIGVGNVVGAPRAHELIADFGWSRHIFVWPS